MQLYEPLENILAPFCFEEMEHEKPHAAA